VHGKVCGGVIYRARSVTKASETVVVIEVVYYALNMISFFASSLKAASAIARAKVRASTGRDGFIKLRPGPS
jgi:hypothetical protein